MYLKEFRATASFTNDHISSLAKQGLLLFPTVLSARICTMADYGTGLV